MSLLHNLALAQCFYNIQFCGHAVCFSNCNYISVNYISVYKSVSNRFYNYTESF